MATIPMESFQRLTLFYLIGQFPRGVFSSFRLQKVLYYATRDVELKPFTFHHTRHGQYSREASDQLLLMLESAIVKREDLKGQFSGALWQVGDDLDNEALRDAFEQGFPDLARSIAASVETWGYLKQRILDERVHADPDLKARPRGCVLTQGVACESLPIALDEEQAEDLAMLMSPHYISMMNMLRDLKEAHGVLPPEWDPF